MRKPDHASKEIPKPRLENFQTLVAILVFSLITSIQASAATLSASPEAPGG